VRRVLSFLNLVFTTIVLSIAALIASLFDEKGDTVRRIARFWAAMHLRACGITVSITGVDNISKPPYIFMVNHQSALDIYALLCALPVSSKWIAKRQLFSIPFFGWAMKRAGYISIDRENPREALKAINDAARKIKEGTNIVIFPEGTRSKDGVLLPFKKGVFSLVVRAGIPVIPVGIRGTSVLQPKGGFIPAKKGVIYIGIGEPIPVEEHNPSEKAKIMDEVRAAIEKLIDAGSGQ
jgi:1-acyl-sn-glycerol-3-phosphate acyltransferase